MVCRYHLPHLFRKLFFFKNLYLGFIPPFPKCIHFNFDVVINLLIVFVGFASFRFVVHSCFLSCLCCPNSVILDSVVNPFSVHKIPNIELYSIRYCWYFELVLFHWMYRFHVSLYRCRSNFIWNWWNSMDDRDVWLNFSFVKGTTKNNAKQNTRLL